jgi:transcriptional regulator with XRE-family HTH domain
MTIDDVRTEVMRQCGATSQAKVARKAGIAPGHLSEFIAGKRTPSEKFLAGLGFRWTIERIEVEPAT